VASILGGLTRWVRSYRPDLGHCPRGRQPVSVSRRPYLKGSQPHLGADHQERPLLGQACFCQERAPLFVKPSPTSTVPKVVPATISAAVEPGTVISTPDKFVSIITSALCESLPSKLIS
jgi:hypothetical protein